MSLASDLLMVDPAELVPGDVFERMVALRRDLHENPELSGEETRTARRIADELSELGVEARSEVGGTGVVLDIPGKSDGPRVALRADTDALPVHEETGLEFSSKRDGVMHACGHDGHTSLLFGAAMLLTNGEPPPLPVRLLWQPAEERGAGAKAMIADGVLDGVGMIFGGHLDRHYPPGVLAISDGPVNASSDKFTIDIHGQSGHGARPHEAVDAVVVGSLLVTAIQTVVSREVDPAHPSVLSIGSFHAGSAPNVIAGTARLEGTIRTQEVDVRDHLRQAIIRISKSIGQLHGAEVDVEITGGTPPVVNLPEPTRLAREAAEQVLGPEAIVPLHTANMGGEDFSYYLEHVPGSYIRFGGQVKGREGFPAHSSRFDFDERALAVGARWLARVAHLAGEHLSRVESPGT